jgi:fatty acid synthase subunit alpha, fungi type
VAASIDADKQSTRARTAVLLNALKHFTSTYLTTKDVHSLAAKYDTEVRKSVISGYYAAVAALQEKEVQDIPTSPESALFKAAKNGDASIYALFGGQGVNEVYFDELQYLYDTYKPFVSSYLTTLSEQVLKPLADENEDTLFYTHGLDIISWLSGASPVPPVSYFASGPVSAPLIGVTQLTQYLVTARVANVTPGELRSHFAGVTGHSQGITSAVVVAASATFEDFTKNSIKATRWQFFSGMRAQSAFPVVSLEPSIVADCVEGGEGTPSPMLSVVGLSLAQLEPHIKKTNEHLAANSQLNVSLHNGPQAFVVTGPPRALFGLVTSLRKIRAPSGADQSKVQFSQRKPVFSVRYLPVSIPYHSEYLADAPEEMIDEDLEREELWKVEELAIPVYSTADGKNSLRSIYLDSLFY